jgi:glycosyltransferase involved in cell wall biosynthesis
VRLPWSDQLAIGWAGGRRPHDDLLPMAEAWSRVARRVPHVVFVVVGDDRSLLSQHVPADRLHRVTWLNHVPHYPMAMQVDIGCCPLADNDFNRMKTPIKCWEFALGGGAVVASPTLYSQDVSDGFTGRLAVTTDDWEAAIMDLVEHRERREAYQQALSARVERFHALDTELWRWPATWRSIVHGKQAGRGDVAITAPGP